MDLLAGKDIEITATSAKTGNDFSVVKLTDEQREKIEAGEKVLIKGMKSKKTGKTFDAYLSLEDKPDGTRGIAFSFDK